MNPGLLRVLAIPIGLFACSLVLRAQEVGNISQMVDSIVAEQKEKHSIPGLAIGIVAADSLLLTKGYGIRSVESRLPVTKNSVFHTASITKLFTAEAVMLLVNEGKIELSDKIVQVAPMLRYDDPSFKSVTIEHLLRHTSGLADVQNYRWGKVAPGPTALQDYFEDLELALVAKPGSKVKYCNRAYDLLGYLLEIVSGQQFDLYLQSSIFQPLGMKNSDTRAFMIAESLATEPHSKKKVGSGMKTLGTYPYNPQHAPSSTLNSSVYDLAIWMDHFFNNLSDPESYFTGMIADTEPHPIGFQYYTMDDFTGYGHFGGDRGFRSFMLLVPEYKLGIVLLGNSDYSDDYRQEIVLPIARYLINLKK